MTLTEMANRMATPSEQREPLSRPFSVTREGDQLVIRVDCSEAAIQNAHTTSNGNKLLLSSRDLNDGESQWADVGHGIGLNIAVTARGGEPRQRYERQEYDRPRRRYSRPARRWPRYGEDWR